MCKKNKNPLNKPFIPQACSTYSIKTLSQNWTWTGSLDLRRNVPVRKAGPQGLKMLPFVSCHMKDNVEVIHFHIKSKGVQGLVLVQITFEKYTTNFYFENGEVDIKTTIANY